MSANGSSLTRWILRHALVVWLGIVLNLFFALPLLFYPEWLIGLFGLPYGPTVWPRFIGVLLIILSVFYVPATLDIDRYRIFAWLHVLPGRTLGVVFFTLAVFAYGQPYGFLVAVLLDGLIGSISLYCLIRATELEAQLAQQGAGA